MSWSLVKPVRYIVTPTLLPAAAPAWPMAVAENCAGNATWAAALDMMLTENKTGTANSQTRVMSDRNFIFFTSSLELFGQPFA
jgi:hypothetical protein